MANSPSADDATTTSSHFLNLPAELRLHIYEYLLQPQGPVDLVLDAHESVPPIVRTCRLLRSETLPIFFSSALHFTCPDNNYNKPNPVTDWIAANLSPEASKHVTELNVYIDRRFTRLECGCPGIDIEAGIDLKSKDRIAWVMG